MRSFWNERILSIQFFNSGGTLDVPIIAVLVPVLSLLLYAYEMQTLHLVQHNYYNYHFGRWQTYGWHEYIIQVCKGKKNTNLTKSGRMGNGIKNQLFNE